MAKNIPASSKQVIEDASGAALGTYSLPTRVVDPSSGLAAGVSETGLLVDLGGAAITITSGTVYGSGPVTSPFTNAPAAHTAADAQLAAVSAKKNSVVTVAVTVKGTGSTPAATLTLVEDLAGADTIIYGPVTLPGFGLFNFAFPGGLQQPTADKTLDVIVSDPGANNTVAVAGTYFNS
jgi:hypothetical protein